MSSSSKEQLSRSVEDIVKSIDEERKKKNPEEYVEGLIIHDILKKNPPSFPNISIIADYQACFEFNPSVIDLTTIEKLIDKNIANVKDLKDFDVSTEHFVRLFVSDRVHGTHNFKIPMINFLSSKSFPPQQIMEYIKRSRRNLEVWLCNYITDVLHCDNSTYAKNSNDHQKEVKDIKKQEEAHNTEHYIREVHVKYFIDCYVHNLFNPKYRQVESSCSFTVYKPGTNERILRDHFYIDEECSIGEGHKKIREFAIQNSSLINDKTQFKYFNNRRYDFNNAHIPTIRIVYTKRQNSAYDVHISANFSDNNEYIYNFKIDNEKELVKELKAFVRGKFNIPDEWYIKVYQSPEVSSNYGVLKRPSNI